LFNSHTHDRTDPLGAAGDGGGVDAVAAAAAVVVAAEPTYATTQCS